MRDFIIMKLYMVTVGSVIKPVRSEASSDNVGGER